MNQCTFLSADEDGLTPAETVRRLRKAFTLVHTNYHLGGYRVGQVIRKLRELQAPNVILEHYERRRQEALQVTVYDGEPLTAVLDLTVQQDSVRAYHESGAADLVRRVALALGCEIDEDDEGSGLDERASPEEKRHRANVRKTRSMMAALQNEFEGAEALFASGTQVSRVRVYDLKLTEPNFSASVELLPTPGLCNELRTPFRFTWWWDEFSCSAECWARGPLIVERFTFGADVTTAVNYGGSLANPEYTSQRRHEIAEAIRQLRRKLLEPYAEMPLQLFWNSTVVGAVCDHNFDEFPLVKGKLAIAAIGVELREALAWWAKDTSSLAEDEAQPFPDELVEGWWLAAPDGARLEISWMPTVDFEAQTIEWRSVGITRR